jgi:hypothetical protein
MTVGSHAFAFRKEGESTLVQLFSPLTANVVEQHALDPFQTSQIIATSRFTTSTAFSPSRDNNCIVADLLVNPIHLAETRANTAGAVNGSQEVAPQLTRPTMLSSASTRGLQ